MTFEAEAVEAKGGKVTGDDPAFNNTFMDPIRDAVERKKLIPKCEGAPCVSCGSKNTSTTETQTRSGDEPGTFRTVCYNCSFVKIS